MVIQHNIAAMNNNRQLSIVSKNLAKNSEKLSSGYRINRGADDAAGLSISEKMRKQIRGLTRATANIEDGVSLCRVADGAMAEMQDMIHRMNELCIQSANGTNSSTDRTYIQSEIDQIVTEFDRIIQTTKFNELYIFQGNEKPIMSADGIEYQYIGRQDGIPYEGKGSNSPRIDTLIGVTAYGGGNLGDTITYDNTANTWNVINDTYPLTYGRNYSCAWIDFDGFTATSKDDLAKQLQGKGFDSSCAYCTTKFYGIKFDNTTPTSATAAGGTAYSYAKASKINNGYSIDSEVIKLNTDSIWAKYQSELATNPTYKLGEAMCFALLDVIQHAGNNSGSNLTNHFTSYGYETGSAKLYIISNQGAGAGSSTFSKISRNDTGGFDDYIPDEFDITRLVVHTILEEEDTNIHAGSESERPNKLYIKLPTMSKDSIMINKVCALTEDLATKSIDYLDYALKQVSSHRSRMGAYQNRLEHADKNLNNVVENTTGAESQIRDTDMATEMVKFSNNSILQQAGQAMLSQSSKSNQGVLSLING